MIRVALNTVHHAGAAGLISNASVKILAQPIGDMNEFLKSVGGFHDVELDAVQIGLVK